MTDGPLVVLGDTLLDRDLLGSVVRMSPEAPIPVVSDLAETDRPGGAGLTALLAAREARGTGVEVVLVTALADDEAGDLLRRMLAPHVRLVLGRCAAPTAEKVRVRCDGQPLLRIDHGAPNSGPVGITPAMREAVERAGVVLVSDYGRGMAQSPELRSLLEGIALHRPVVWDPHPRGSAPTARVRIATPNFAEAVALCGLSAWDAGDRSELETAARAARDLAHRWSASSVAVTLGATGALLDTGSGNPRLLPAPAVRCVDPCGAGDQFAAAVALALHRGASPPEAVGLAVAAAARYVGAGGAEAVLGPILDAAEQADAADKGTAGRGTAQSATDLVAVADPRGMAIGAGGTDGHAAAAPANGAVQASHPAEEREPDDPTGVPAAVCELVERVRAAHGTVVATGGCFDLLHAGHAATLQEARRLGDLLVVCVNSDRSVRRCKGKNRPIVPETDRVRLLSALGCVDAVVVFDDDTPERVLAELRPDIWVKGGDYGEQALPESELVRGWGGQVVILPYLSGRSTSHLVETVASSLRDEAVSRAT